MIEILDCSWTITSNASPPTAPQFLPRKIYLRRRRLAALPTLALQPIASGPSCRSRPRASAAFDASRVGRPFLIDARLLDRRANIKAVEHDEVTSLLVLSRGEASGARTRRVGTLERRCVEGCVACDGTSRSAPRYATTRKALSSPRGLDDSFSTESLQSARLPLQL